MLTPAQKPRGLARMIFIAKEAPDSLSSRRPYPMRLTSGEKARRVGRTISAIVRVTLALLNKVARSGSFSERFAPLQRPRRPRTTRVQMTVLCRSCWIYLAQITSF